MNKLRFLLFVFGIDLPLFLGNSLFVLSYIVSFGELQNFIDHLGIVWFTSTLRSDPSIEGAIQLIQSGIFEDTVGSPAFVDFSEVGNHGFDFSVYLQQIVVVVVGYEGFDVVSVEYD